MKGQVGKWSPLGIQDALGGGLEGVQVTLGAQFEAPSGVQVALGGQLEKGSKLSKFEVQGAIGVQMDCESTDLEHTL